MLCVGSSISCSLFDVINQPKYEIYKLVIISISVIHEDKSGIEKMNLQHRETGNFFLKNNLFQGVKLTFFF